MMVILALAVFVSVVRPISRPIGHLYARLGLTRMSLLTESASDEDAAVLQPAHAIAHLVRPLLVIAVLLLALKTRRFAFRPIPLRRVKRPQRQAATALFTDQH